MTEQGRLLFGLHQGAPSDELLSDDVYFNQRVIAQNARLQGVPFVSKSIKLGPFLSEVATRVLGMTLEFYSSLTPKGTSCRCLLIEKMSRTVAAREAWERCHTQIKAIETKSEKKRKELAVSHIVESFEPMLNQARYRYKLTEDEIIQTFEEAVQLLKVRLVMKA